MPADWVGLRPARRRDGNWQVLLRVPVPAGFWELARALALSAAAEDVMKLPEEPSSAWMLPRIRETFAHHGAAVVALWHERCPKENRLEVAEWAYWAAHRLWGPLFQIVPNEIRAELSQHKKEWD